MLFHTKTVYWIQEPWCEVISTDSYFCNWLTYRELSYIFQVRGSISYFLKAATSNISLECPLTSTTLKTALPNILKIASNQSIFMAINMRQIYLVLKFIQIFYSVMCDTTAVISKYKPQRVPFLCWVTIT